MNLTREEELAVNRLKRAFKNLPDTLRVYGIDRTLTVCKDGVSSDDYCDDIGDFCGAGVILSYLHDECNNDEQD